MGKTIVWSKNFLNLQSFLEYSTITHVAIFCGTSSGLNVAGAIQLAEELGEGNTVVTVAVDTGLKYLNGDLF